MIITRRAGDTRIVLDDRRCAVRLIGLTLDTEMLANTVRSLTSVGISLDTVVSWRPGTGGGADVEASVPTDDVAAVAEMARQLGRAAGRTTVDVVSDLALLRVVGRSVEEVACRLNQVMARLELTPDELVSSPTSLAWHLPARPPERVHLALATSLDPAAA